MASWYLTVCVCLSKRCLHFYLGSQERKRNQKLSRAERRLHTFLSDSIAHEQYNLRPRAASALRKDITIIKWCFCEDVCYRLRQDHRGYYLAICKIISLLLLQNSPRNSNDCSDSTPRTKVRRGLGRATERDKHHPSESKHGEKERELHIPTNTALPHAARHPPLRTLLTSAPGRLQNP